MAGFSGVNAGTDSLDLENNSAATLALSTSAAQSAALTEGVYDIWCSTGDCFVRVAPTATGVTAANGYLLRASITIRVRVREGSKIGAIVASGTPTLSYHKVA
jgi:hypothetical protein